MLQHYSAQFIEEVKEMLAQLGEVKTVKYVREQTGMSLIQAKQFVDACKA